MEIRQVNGYMAKAMATEKNKGNEVLKEVAPDSVFENIDSVNEVVYKSK